MHRRMRFVILAVFVSVLVLQTVAVLAYPVSGWTRYLEGLEYAWGYTTSPRLMRAFAVRVSLRNPYVSLYATPHSGSLDTLAQSTPNFRSAYGLGAAINANWTDPGTYEGKPVNVWGILVSNGSLVSGYGPNESGALGFTSSKDASFYYGNFNTSGYHTVISGSWLCLADGSPMSDGTSILNPRSTVGISQDGKYLIMCVIDGRQPGWSDGCTYQESGQWQKDFGAWNAINEDGGGSSCICTSSGGILNRPSDGSPRAVAANLGSYSSHGNAEGPVSVSWNSDRVDVFSRGNLGHLNHRAWASDHGWYPLEDMGGGMYYSPAVCSRGSGLLDVFILGWDNEVYQNSWNGSSWSGFTSLDGFLTSAPAACARDANNMTVFARGMDNAIWYRSWNSSTGWSWWDSLGGGFTSGPAACARDANNMTVFAMGQDYAMWYKSWNSSTGWSGWQTLGGGFTSDPAACARDANNMCVFARGEDYALWCKSWNSSTGWSGWTSLGGYLAGKPGASKRNANLMDVFVRGTDDRLYQYYWDVGGWHGPLDLETFY